MYFLNEKACIFKGKVLVFFESDSVCGTFLKEILLLIFYSVFDYSVIEYF